MFQTLLNAFNPAAYVNPWSVLAGVLLIAAPIVIHLIHRMRFRRVKWAAMEFLLKAQKRMKRKMIIEQLLLLILRCLLMLLIGLLVGRFFGFNASTDQTATTFHYVILDDSPSMGDLIQEEGQEPISAFEKGKRTLTDKIAPALSDATTPQFMDVTRASEPDNPLPVGRLNRASIDELKANLGQYQTATARPDLTALIKKGGEQLNTHGPETGKVLHVLSDFRAADWAEQGEGIKEEVKRLTDAGVKVHFIDVAHPYRKADKKVPTFHDNIGIVALTPAKAVVARYEAVEFTLKLKNFGTAEVKDVRVSIRVNGDEGKGGRSVVFPSLPPGQEVSERFELNFERSGAGDNPFAGKPVGSALNEGDKGELKRAFERFNLVSAVIETKEGGGLDADNVRHTAVEVRETLPILVVDGDPEKREKKEGDSLYLRKFIISSGTAFQWNYAAPTDLAGTDLSKYSFVLVLNVPSLSEAAIRNLEGFVANGGGCGFWLGALVKPAEYNKTLYRDGAGLFPAPLPQDPFPVKPREQMSPDEQAEDDDRIERLKFNIFQKKLLVRDPSRRLHPALAGMYADGRGTVRDPDALEKFYRFVTVQRYWPIERIGKWVEDKSVTELMCLANERKAGDYEQEANARVKDLQGLIDDPELAKYKDALTKFRKAWQATLAGEKVTTAMLADQFDRLLSDQRNEGDPDEALLREFWQDARTADLKGKVMLLRDRMKYGYPLYLAKNFGRGRVTLVTTTAGEAWTDWPSAQPGNVSFIPVMKELVNYLAGGGVDDTRTCGKPVTFQLDPDSYDPKVLRGFVTHAAKPGEKVTVGGANDPAPVTVGGQFDPLAVQTVKDKVTETVDGKAVEKEVERKTLTVSETNTSRPGVYLFGLEQKRPKPGSPTETVTAAEYRFAPVNLDVPAEGDLRRANTDDVLAQAPGGQLHPPDETDWLDKLKNKKTDLSEMGWLFLFIFLVLVAEQALAVKLSYHAGQETMAEHAPSAAAAMRRTNPQPGPGDGPAA